MSPSPNKTIRIEIQLTPDDNDADDVSFKIDGQVEGFGFRAKDSGKVHIIRCPACHKENYAIIRATGRCAWCGLDANDLEKGVSV